MGKKKQQYQFWSVNLKFSREIMGTMAQAPSNQLHSSASLNSIILFANQLAIGSN